MANAFQSLGDDSYGPQFVHNVAVLAIRHEGALHADCEQSA